MATKKTKKWFENTTKMLEAKKNASEKLVFEHVTNDDGVLYLKFALMKKVEDKNSDESEWRYKTVIMIPYENVEENLKAVSMMMDIELNKQKSKEEV